MMMGIQMSVQSASSNFNLNPVWKKKIEKVLIQDSFWGV
jgi:hypothetical protein